MSDVNDRKEAGLGCPLHVATDELLNNHRDSTSAAAVTAKCFAVVTRDPQWQQLGTALVEAAHHYTKTAETKISDLLMPGDAEATGEVAVASGADVSAVQRSLLAYSTAVDAARRNATLHTQKTAYSAAYLLADQLHRVYANDPNRFHAQLARPLTHAQRHLYSAESTELGAPFKSLRRKLSKAKRSASKKVRTLRGAGGVGQQKIPTFKRANPVADRVYLSPGAIMIPQARDDVMRDEHAIAYSLVYLFADQREASRRSFEINSRAEIVIDFNRAFSVDGGATNVGLFSSDLNWETLDTPGAAWALNYYGRKPKSKPRNRLGTVFVWLINRNARHNTDDYTLRGVSGVQLSVQATFFLAANEGDVHQPAMQTRFGGRLVMSGGKPGTLTQWMASARNRIGEEESGPALPPRDRSQSTIVSAGGVTDLVGRAAELQYKRLLTGTAVSYRIEAPSANQMLVLTFTRFQDPSAARAENKYWFRLESVAVFISDKEPIRGHF